jgi:hypothetical protein
MPLDTDPQPCASCGKLFINWPPSPRVCPTCGRRVGRIGETLPPFCGSCLCREASTREAEPEVARDRRIAAELARGTTITGAPTAETLAARRAFDRQEKAAGRPGVPGWGGESK